MIEEKSWGQTNYEAYAEALGSLLAMGWDELLPQDQQLWEAAALAVRLRVHVAVGLAS